MSDISLPSIEQAPQAAGNSAESVSNVLIEQVDAKISAIETRQKQLVPFQTAVAAASDDVTRIQAAAAKTTNSSVAAVYARALEVAEELVIKTREDGEGVIKQIEKLQSELKDLLAQLKEKDPENPLVAAL